MNSNNIHSWILLLLFNSLSEPHVSEHVDPSIGRKVTVGDIVGPRLTVGNDDTVGDSVGNGKVGGDVVVIWGSKHSPHSEHTSLA